MQCKIEKVLVRFVEDTHIPQRVLFDALKKQNKNIDKKLLSKLVTEASGGESAPDGVLFGDLVRLYLATPGKFDTQKKAVIQELA